MSREIDTLSEELTCQKVMLRSLEDVAYDGVDDDRNELRREIVRLSRLLDKARRGEPAVEDNQSAWSRSGTPQPGPATPGPSRASRPDALLPSDPSTAQTEAAVTPSGRAIMSDAGSISLPGRKRERSSTGLDDVDGANKSRRTTPTPSSRSDVPGAFGSSQASSQHFDVIDLTGDDGLDQTLLAHQSREAARRAQEAKDHRMALELELSAQSQYPQERPAHTGQNNAFNRIMETQQLNYPPSSSHETVRDDSDDGDSDDVIFDHESTPSSTSRPTALPWVKQEHPQPNFGRHVTGARPGHRNGRYHSPAGSQPLQLAPGSSPYGPPGPATPLPGPSQLLHHSSPAYHAGKVRDRNPANTAPPAGHRGLPPLPRAHAYPGFTNASNGFPVSSTWPHPDPLAAVIQRTSGYDYVNGTDKYGNQLPSRVTDYIHDVMHDSRVSDKELDDLLKNIRPDFDIPEKNRDGTPEGLKGTLYRHQELALTWLKQMEEGTNKGGILADDMGLGKTISVISLMLSRKATARPKTNLVVAPLALLRQWEEEIRSKIKPSHRLSTFIYHGKKATTDDLLKYDVVLTTYGTLAAELKRLEKWQEDNGDRTVDFNDKSIAAKCPLLHPTKARFYRVILDEAQCIKNKRTQTSKAACRLRATHRWCLTGTPMMNGVEELFSLLQFLKIKPYCHWEQFSRSFGSLFGRQGEPKGSAMERLRTVLKAIMLRRKKDSQLDGKPILRLPPKGEEEVHVELSPDERDFYTQLESKSQVLFNKYLRENSIGKNYSSILVLLLRLRQACCHPHLNLDVEDAVGPTTEDMTELVKGLDENIVTRIKQIDAFECPICYDAVPSPSFFIPCGHDSCSQCLTQLVDSAMSAAIREGNEGAQSRCPVCRGTFDPKRCFNYETFRKIHMPETQDEAKAEEVASDGDGPSEYETDSGEEDEDGEDEDDVDEAGNLKGFVVEDGFSDDDVKRAVKDEEAGPSTESKPKTKKKKTKKRSKKDGKAKAEEVKASMLKTLRVEGTKNRAAYKRYMAYLRKTWLPSAKVSECMKLLRSIQEESGEKTIIFSQWTLLLDLLEVAMHHEDFATKPVRYDGSMSGTQRHDAAYAFSNRADVKVILVSLRAGNAGLNLTAASRVIILDPFWNPYIEMQAVDRAYRIGQQREVKVYRILTTETVEDRIVELQKRKRDIVEAALDETESRKIGRLSTQELKFLFSGTH